MREQRKIGTSEVKAEKQIQMIGKNPASFWQVWLSLQKLLVLSGNVISLRNISSNHLQSSLIILGVQLPSI